MNPGSSNIGTGGTQVSLLNNINPEEIADIEIVKGPSAATLYGPTRRTASSSSRRRRARPARRAGPGMATAASCRIATRTPRSTPSGDTRPGNPAHRGDVIIVTIPPARASPTAPHSYNLISGAARHHAEVTMATAAAVRTRGERSEPTPCVSSSVGDLPQREHGPLKNAGVCDAQLLRLAQAPSVRDEWDC